MDWPKTSIILRYIIFSDALNIHSMRGLFHSRCYYIRSFHKKVKVSWDSFDLFLHNYHHAYNVINNSFDFGVED